MKERDFAQTLDTLKKASDPSKRVISWERQVKLPLTVNGHFIANYYIDFKAKYADGHEEFIEIKGFETDTWRMKWRILEAIAEQDYPGINLVVIK